MTSPRVMMQNDSPEPFPSLKSPPSPKSPTDEHSNPNRSRQTSSTSTLQSRLRSASKSFQESSPPTGMCIATAQVASSVPSLSDIRRGSYNSDGWSGEGQIREKKRRASLSTRRGSQTGEERRSSVNPHSPKQPSEQFHHDSVPEAVEERGQHELAFGPSAGITLEDTDGTSKPMEMGTRMKKQSSTNQRSSSDIKTTPHASAANTGSQFLTTPFDNGYQFPPKHTWIESTAIFLTAFWKFFITPVGFLVTIYGLNVVAWGGMLFLLLCNASPAMCKPTCNDINSGRRIWIEIDSQILNALFCVTGFGTIPWRFRDLYYLLQYRIQKNEMGLRRLAGINRGWFRLAGSEDLPAELGPSEIETEISNISESSVPFPVTKIPKAPLTGIRAPPTAMWKLDFVIWAMVWNTFLQALLAGFMWGLNRYKRPPWSTGLFVALACTVAICGGIMAFVEGKHVKAIEGVPVSEKDQARLKRDREMGITHYNNIKDEKPKEKKARHLNGISKRKHKAEEEVEVEESALETGVEYIVR